jgi:lysozyme
MIDPKPVFDYLRQLSGGKLTQEQVDKINAFIESFKPVDSTMKLNQAGIDLIAGFEGYRSTAYLDSAGIWTIGFGATFYPNGVKVKKGDTCTVEQAKQYKAHDLKRFEKCVNDVVKVKINQNQYNALVSLTYNIGESAFKNSTLARKLNSGDYQGAADQFLAWNKAGGKVVQGLVNRRTAERKLFLK